jgi:mycofactocin system glycosyltransferase
MGPARRYRTDRTWRRFGHVMVGGSPLKLFRVTDAGTTVVDRITAGSDVPESDLVAALTDAGAIHPIPGAATGSDVDDVTIVVPTLGPPAHAPAGAIIVDDGSRPPVAGASVRLDPNQGPAAARSAGLALVTTPLVAFVDADVRLPDGWLAPLLPHFDDPRVALVAPRVVTDADGSALARYESRHSPLDLGPDPARIRAGTRVSYVPAAAIVCRTDALHAVGGFDTTLRFGEDVDLVWRLDEAGWRCRYEPAAVVVHEARPNWISWVRQRIDYGSSTAPLARRHPGALAPLRLSGWSLAAWLLGAVGRPVTGAVVALGSAAALVRKLPDVPAADAFRLALSGNLRAGEQIARAVRRTWWPLLAMLAWRSPAARRSLLAAAVAAVHPVVLVDDVASSIGVWTGMLTERTIAPLVPELGSWPGPSARPRHRDENHYRPTP